METQRTRYEAPGPRSPDVDTDHRLKTLTERLERLEKAHEGLQDALYRHEVLQDKDQNVEADFRRAQRQRLV
jgi:hypothetical protein